ncbi:MAG: hypothetical protein GXP17_07960 [Gammaproteobacteria bacterium]|nr:hypothetical protein [Gammaproteobacteria bacterium]
MTLVSHHHRRKIPLPMSCAACRLCFTLHRMSQHPQTPLATGITYHDRLPVDWRVLPVVPDEAALRRYSEENSRLIQAFNVLDEHPQEAEDSLEGVLPENRRLEAKLDFLMSMLGEMLAAQAHMPEPRPIIMGAAYLHIGGEQQSVGPQGGELLVLRLFLDARFPKPLQLPGVVSGEGEMLADDGFTVRFLGISEVLRDELEKQVFRHHRRAVALARQHDKKQ